MADIAVEDFVNNVMNFILQYDDSDLLITASKITFNQSINQSINQCVLVAGIQLFHQSGPARS